MTDFSNHNYIGVVGVVWLCTCLPIQVFGTLWFWLRRELQPIKARVPVLSVAANLVFIIVSLMLPVKFLSWDSYPCKLNMWHMYIIGAFLGPIYCLRCFLLWFTFELTHERIEMAEKNHNFNVTLRGRQLHMSRTATRTRIRGMTKGGSHGSLSESTEFRFVDNLYLKSPKFLLTVGAIVVLTVITPAVVASAMSIPGSTRDDECVENSTRKWASTLALVIDALYLVLFVYLGNKLRNTYDGFMIKRELATSSKIGVMGLLFFLTIEFQPDLNHIDNEDFMMNSCNVLVIFFAVFCVSILWPLYLSYHPEKLSSIAAGDTTPAEMDLQKNRKLSSSHRRGSISTVGNRVVLTEEMLRNVSIKGTKGVSLQLKEVLADSAGYVTFEMFLGSEFSVENILFWQDVNDFEANLRMYQERHLHPERFDKRGRRRLSMSNGASPARKSLAGPAKTKDMPSSHSELNILTLPGAAHEHSSSACSDENKQAEISHAESTEVPEDSDSDSGISDDEETMQEFLDWAKDIYNTYIDEAGAMQVNIPANILGRIIVDMRKLRLLHAGDEDLHLPAIDPRNSFSLHNGAGHTGGPAVTLQIGGEQPETVCMEEVRVDLDDGKDSGGDQQMSQHDDYDGVAVEVMLHMFKAAHLEIYRLMARDSYIRYLRSPFFKRLVKAVQDREVQKQRVKVLRDMKLDVSPSSNQITASPSLQHT